MEYTKKFRDPLLDTTESPRNRASRVHREGAIIEAKQRDHDGAVINLGAVVGEETKIIWGDSGCARHCPSKRCHIVASRVGQVF
jgi:hypothetical protein